MVDDVSNVKSHTPPWTDRSNSLVYSWTTRTRHRFYVQLSSERFIHLVSEKTGREQIWKMIRQEEINGSIESPHKVGPTSKDGQGEVGTKVVG